MANTDSPSASHPTQLDLRHMTSAGHLSSQRSPHRAPQLPRLGSRSPNSIPSSPTSVHSSSSAIFERDIEPVVPPSPPFLAHQNPHRIPRAKGTEQLEHSVPSVLDSAASILATLDDSGESVDHVAVVAPVSTSPAFDSILARGTSSGFASPIGSFRSRSPSPLGLRVATGPGPMPRTDLLLNIPPPTTTASPQGTSGPATTLSSPTHSIVPSLPVQNAVPRPTVQTNTNPATTTSPPPPPAIVTPTTSQFSTSSSVESGDSSPATSTACEHTARQAISSETSVSGSAPSSHLHSPSTSPSQLGTTHPSHFTTTIPIPTTSTSTSTSTSVSASASVFPSAPVHPITTSHTHTPINLASPTSRTSTLSHPPSPTHAPAKRLSFMAYSDLLSSTPTSTLPLSSLTTSASSMEPPPHIPSVSGLNLASAAQLGLLNAAVVNSSPGGAAAHGAAPGSVKGGSAATSLRGFVMGPMGGITHAGKRDSIAMLDDVGGEWEREGLGKGLEERLEALIALPTAQVQPVVVTRT